MYDTIELNIPFGTKLFLPIELLDMIPLFQTDNVLPSVSFTLVNQEYARANVQKALNAYLAGRAPKGVVVNTRSNVAVCA